MLLYSWSSLDVSEDESNYVRSIPLYAIDFWMYVYGTGGKPRYLATVFSFSMLVNFSVQSN
jgi:hypothetical protein